mmetsp:Transcript_51239/g.136086  ORF Transcript_51239/g.136086 Transcript_51239/m.136086 type:complete len:205 (+) Transcript_51239:104-718(+)
MKSMAGRIPMLWKDGPHWDTELSSIAGLCRGVPEKATGSCAGDGAAVGGGADGGSASILMSLRTLLSSPSTLALIKTSASCSRRSAILSTAWGGAASAFGGGPSPSTTEGSSPASSLASRAVSSLQPSIRVLTWAASEQPRRGWLDSSQSWPSCRAWSRRPMHRALSCFPWALSRGILRVALTCKAVPMLEGHELRKPKRLSHA